MSDLVERLRKLVKAWLEISGGRPRIFGFSGLWVTTDILHEAADEIERLRACVAELEAFAREVTGV